MAKAAVLLLDRKAVLSNGAIVQIKVWRLPEPSTERPHGLKYSLFYGRPGERIVGCDNEAGKGGHRRYRDREEPYAFTNLEALIADSERDVKQELENERS